MKLIDILVRELPNRGGWPNGGAEITQDADGCLCIWKLHGAQCNSGYWSHSSGVGLLQYWSGMNAMPGSEDGRESIITKDKYEAALAASKPGWDGEGLPPVGCEFLFGTHQTKAKCIAVGRDVIFASIGNPDEEDGAYEEFVISIHHSEFRPIRSEAEKKRAEGVIALSRVDPNVAPFEYGDKHSDGSLIGSAWYELYDAIASGKIPHIRID